MEKYVVSARKYRPVTFDSVVGQRHISETLKNAIKSDHLAQAFLFSGPRGVGKTTCARILAKTINCTDRSEKVEACDKCESCESFNEGHSLNIYELDAASNNSVEDIRALIEQVRFAPQIGTKKVYIIDEVHMLSAQAFNAFLKTLEEPPSHAIFILATTEKHKIIPTILSRCQVFDFNRIEIDEMVRHLELIAEKEGIKAEADALHLIAQKSDGSLRDSLSMFDQMVTYSGNELSYKAVVENLSILDADYFFTLTDNLVTGDTPASMLLFNEVLQKGFDGHNFLLGFAEHLRNLLVCQDHSTVDLLSAGSQMKERFTDQTLRVSSDFLIKALNLVSRADVNYKSAKNQRLLVELTLINLSNLKSEKASSEGKTSIPTASDEIKKKPAEPTSSVEKPVKKEVSSPVETAKTAEKENPTPTEAVKEVDSVPADKETISASIETETAVAEVKTEEKVEEPDRNEEDDPKASVHKEIVEKRESEPVKPEPAPKPEPVPEKKPTKRYDPSVMSDTISINAFTDKKEKEIEEQKSAGLNRTESFDQKKLEEVWKEIVSSFDSKGRLSLQTTLSRYKPSIVSENVVEFQYDNKAQQQAISEEMTGIMRMLKNGLKNDSVTLNLKISDAKYQRPYTPAEKLEKLIEKNPNINLLKNKLDLDIGQ